VGECSTVVCKDQGSNLTAGGSIWSVCQCLLATTVSWAKMAEMIKILFWVQTQVGPRNQGEGTIFFWGGGHLLAHCKILGISGVRSTFSTLFGRWQQQHGLLQLLLQQFVIVVNIGVAV